MRGEGGERRLAEFLAEGKEDDDRGREVQGGVDKARRGAGGRGGWQRRRPGPGRGPGGGERARARRATVTARDRTTARWICRHISEGVGSLLLPLVDRCGPVDGNGSDRGDKWQSNRSQSVTF
jgi:hypothetical protein